MADGAGLVHPGLPRDWGPWWKDQGLPQVGKGRTQVLLGVVVRIQREDCGTLDTSSQGRSTGGGRGRWVHVVSQEFHIRVSERLKA